MFMFMHVYIYVSMYIDVSMYIYMCVCVRLSMHECVGREVFYEELDSLKATQKTRHFLLLSLLIVFPQSQDLFATSGRV